MLIKNHYFTTSLSHEARFFSYLNFPCVASTMICFMIRIHRRVTRLKAFFGFHFFHCFVFVDGFNRDCGLKGKKSECFLKWPDLLLPKKKRQAALLTDLIFLRRFISSFGGEEEVRPFYDWKKVKMFILLERWECWATESAMQQSVAQKEIVAPVKTSWR